MLIVFCAYHKKVFKYFTVKFLYLLPFNEIKYSSFIPIVRLLLYVILCSNICEPNIFGSHLVVQCHVFTNPIILSISRSIFSFRFGNSPGFKRFISSTYLMVWHQSTLFGRAKVYIHLFINKLLALLYPFHLNFGIKIIIYVSQSLSSQNINANDYQLHF